MPQIINKLRRHDSIEFGRGSFDEWCVYLKIGDKNKYAPSDKDYFQNIRSLAQKHGFQTIYDDFVVIYNRTTKELNPEILKLILAMSYNYRPDEYEFEIWFNVLYAGMIAEENKTHAILKKRIKRLGMYQLLIEKKLPEEAAEFSRGKNWKQLDQLMKRAGF